MSSGSSVTTVNGNLTISANAAATANTPFHGVDVNGGTLQVTGSGNLSITSVAGRINAGLNGVYVRSGGTIMGGVAPGTVTINGTSGNVGADNYGVEVTGSGSLITSSGASVSVTGTGNGGAGGSGTYGVYVNTSGVISSGGAATVMVDGTGGDGSGGDQTGVTLASGGQITSGGAGTVTVQGTGGSTSGNNNRGVHVTGSGSQITSGGGAVVVTGIEGVGTAGIALVVNTSGAITTATSGGTLTLIGNSMSIGAPVSAQSGSSVTFRPFTAGVAINLGTATDTIGGPLGLSDTELDQVTAGTISIGNASSGAITVSAAISRTASTAMVLTTASGNNIAFSGAASLNANGGDVTLTAPGTGAITSGTAGTDVSGGLITLSSGSGGIGGSGNPLTMAATTLSASAGGNGDMFLSESDSVSVSLIAAGSGVVELNSGTFNAGGANVIQSSTGVIVNGATLGISTFNQSVASLRLTTGSITGTSGTMTSASTYDVRSGTISAILAGGAGLTKTTAATVTLSGANTYTGATSIAASGGTLFVNGSTHASSLVTINSGGTLGGTGVVNGQVDLTSGGFLAPGVSPGILGTGNLNLANGGTVTFEVNSTTPGTGHDQLDTTGTVTLNTPTLSTGGSSIASVPGQVVRIIDNDSTDSVTGTFSGLAEGSTVVVNSINFIITYVGGDGNDVTLNQAGPMDVVSDGLGAGVLLVRRNGANIEFLDDGVVIDVRPAAAVTQITVDGANAANDTLTVDFATGFFLPVTFNGGTGGTDTLVITDPAGTATTVTHTFVNANDGSVNIDGTVVAYTGLEPVTDNVDAVNRVFTFTGGAETITLADAAGANMTIDSTLGESVTFANPTGSLTINAGTGDDTVSVNSVDTDGPFRATLTINGDAGAADVVNINTALNLGSATSTGSLSIDAETIDINNAVTLGLTGVAGTFSLTGSTITVDAAVDTSAATTGTASISVATSFTTAATADFNLNGAFTQSGAGTVDLAGDIVTSNDSITFASAIQLTANTLNPGSASVVLGGNVTTVAAATVATISGNLNLNGATRTFTVNDGAAAIDLQISAVTSNGGLTKAGAGNLTLSGANTYTGGTSVDAGTLALGASNVLANGGSLTVNGGTLDISTFSDTVSQLILVSGTTSGTTGTLTSTSVIDARSGDVGAILGGTAGLTKTTAGTVTLSGANSYTGTTLISAGTLALGTSNVLANGTDVNVSGGTLSLGANSDTVADVTLTSGSITGSGTLTSNADIDVQSGSVSANLAGSVNLAKTTAGTVTLTGSNSYTGSTAINAGELEVGGGAGIPDTSAVSLANVATAVLDLNGSSETIGNLSGGGGTGGNVTLGSGTLTINQGGTTTYSAAINGTGGVIKAGAGNLTLSGSNGFTGLLRIDAGTITMGANDVLANGSSVNVNGGTLGINTRTDTVNAVTLTSGNITGSSGVLTSSTTFIVEDGAISAILNGTTGLTKQTAGSVSLTGVNTYTGTTAVNNGTLTLGVSNALADGGSVNVNGGTLAIGVNSDTVNGVTLVTGSITGSTGILTSSTTFAVQDGSISARLGGTSGLTKSTAGSVTLSGANTYTGATSVNAGTVLVNGSTAAGSAVTVASTATLGGTGTVNGTVTVNNGGTVAPGVSPGILSSGNVSFAAGSDFDVEVVDAGGDQIFIAGTDYDQLNVTGTVSLGSADLNIISGLAAAPAGALLTIINNDSTDAVTGTFNGLPEDTVVMVGAVPFRISYRLGPGLNDVVLRTNSAPVLTGLTDVSFFENAINATPGRIDSDVTLTDATSFDFDGGNVTVTFSLNGNTEDQLSVGSYNGISRSGNNILDGVTTIGTVPGAGAGSGIDGEDLIITLNANATVAVTERLIEALTYANTSDTPQNQPVSSTRTIEITVYDGDDGPDNTSAPDDAIITVVETNDRPVVTGLDNVTFLENDLSPYPLTLYEIIDTDVTITEPDLPIRTDYGGGFVRVTFTVNGTARDQLRVGNSGNITLVGNSVRYSGTEIGLVDGVFNGVNGVDLLINLDADALVSRVEELIEAIEYSSTHHYPVLTRTINVIVNDGDGTANGGTDTDTDAAVITITEENDDPIVLAFSAVNVGLGDVGETNYSFTVTYRDLDGFDGGPDAISVFTITPADVTVNGPTGLQAEVGAIDLTVHTATEPTGVDGITRVATYTLTPYGGFWDGTDDGTYTISVKALEVADQRSGFAILQTVTTFTVGASINVSNNGDAGVGSLRNAILLANASTQPSVIRINGGVGTITPTTPLPAIEGQTTFISRAASGNNVDGANAAFSTIGGASILFFDDADFNTTTTTITDGSMILNTNITFTGNIIISTDGFLFGDGTVDGTLAVNADGTVAPGLSPGTIAAGNTTFAAGGNFDFEVNEANGTAGTDPGWDTLDITGTLNITASAGTEFNINLNTLTLANVPGTLYDFVNTNFYTWTIATASGGIVGFDPTAFIIDTNNFLNDVGGGTFRMAVSGNDLNLRFIPKPRPTGFIAVSGFTFSTQDIVEDNALLTWDLTLSDPDDPTGTTLTLTATSSKPDIIPGVDGVFTLTHMGGNNWRLQLRPSTDENGNLAVTFAVDDANDTIITSKVVGVRVFSVNDEPSFTLAAANTTVSAGAGLVTVANWAMNIDPGPDNEAFQGVSFIVTGNTNPGLFDNLPAVSATGTLSFRPKLSAAGVATISLVAKDNGNLLNGGVDTSDPALTFTITVTAVANQSPPTITAPTSTTILEDGISGSLALTLTDLDDGTGTSLTVTASSSNPTLIPNNPANLILGGAGNSRTLQIDPAADQFGTAVVTVQVSDGISTATDTINVSVTAVNDEPSFTIGADQSINTDDGAQAVSGWATAITSGPSEGTQNVTFTLTNNNTSLFSRAPKVSSTGTLTYTPNPASTGGVATVTIFIKDNGNTLNGGDNQGPNQTFLITMSADNHAPTVSRPPTTNILEDSASPTLGITLSDAEDPSGATLTLTATSSNTDVIPPSGIVLGGGLDNSRDITLTPTADQFGNVVITLSVEDPDGAVAMVSFTARVLSVNDAPSFTPGDSFLVQTNSGLQSTPWATAISKGPANESSQTLTFQVINDNPTLFRASGQPAINSAGTLTFTPEVDAMGIATISVTLTDNGGISNGGVNSSSTVQFTIEVAHFVYVRTDGNDLNVGSFNTPAAAKLTLQGAVNAVTAGGYIFVGPGTFTGATVVDRAVTIFGNQAGVDARGRVGVESILTVASGTAVLSLQEDNIIVDGFTIRNLNAVNGLRGIETSASFAGYEIANNIIDDHSVGIELASDAGDQVIISQNVISDNNQAGANTGTGVRVLLSNLLMSDNEITGNATAGVQFAGTGQTSLSLEANEITGNGAGILVDATSLGGNGELQIHNGIIAGNTAGINSADGDDIDATNNWWGDASGPFNATNNPTGAGNSVTDFVLFLPVLASAPF